MSGRLENKVAIITGGARGIGYGIVSLFVSEGAKVVIGDIDSKASELESQFGSECLAFKKADVTKEDDIQALVEFSVERFGRLDVMVNNAGALGDQTSLTELDADGFTSTITLLARSAALGHKHAARQMIKQGSGGSVISVSSIAGIEAGWSAASYDAAKAAVINLARSASYELAPRGIRSNVVAPGLILTPIIGTACGIPPEQLDEFTECLIGPYGKLIPIGKPGRPKDIAEAVLFFASDASEHVTGQTLAVDGGLTSMTGFDIGRVVAKALSEYKERVGETEDKKVGWLPKHNG